jgi:uncharacterized protein
MTPQESELIAELFDRLAGLENEPRDPDAERTIADGLRRAPHAVYPLVQTVLVQDEALKQADARIRELEAALGGQPQAGEQRGGFLGSMRDSLFGRREPSHAGSVPEVRPAEPSVWNTTPSRSAWGNQGQPGAIEQAPQYAPPGSYGGGGPFGGGGGPFGGGGGPMGGGGGSFLGNAAATAAGVVGGGLLLGGIRSMMGGGHHSSFGAYNQPGASPGASPWTGGGGSDELSRQAGADDIGRAKPAAFGDYDSQNRAGLIDTAQDDTGSDGDQDYDGDTDDGTDGDSDNV